MGNFVVTHSKDSLTIKSEVTSAELVFVVENDKLKLNSKVKGTENTSGVNNASLLSKFIRDYVNAEKNLDGTDRGDMESRINEVAILLLSKPEVKTFRNLNNYCRKTTDNETIWPLGTNFYEDVNHPRFHDKRVVAGIIKLKEVTNTDNSETDNLAFNDNDTIIKDEVVDVVITTNV